MNEPIINPWWFYLVGNLEGFREASYSLVLTFIVIFLLYLMGCSIDAFKFKKWIAIILIVFASTFNIFAKLIPNETTAYTIIAASMVTPHNLQVAKNTAGDFVEYTGGTADAVATRLAEIITNSATQIIREVKK